MFKLIVNYIIKKNYKQSFKEMKYLHIMINHFYTKDFIDTIQNYLNFNEHQFISLIYFTAYFFGRIYLHMIRYN